MRSLGSLSLSPSAYRRMTLAVAIVLAVIIVTGGAVRLTGSGLGCPDWPNCRPGRLTPRRATDVNAMVEFVNRTFTGLVSIAVVVAVLGSLLRRPRRRDLVWLSGGLVVGVIGQIVLGGLTVLFDLAPQLVMGHFLLSMLLLADAVVLHHRAGRPEGAPLVAVDPVLIRLARVLVLAATVVLVTGTVVTNTGPHAGDRKAKRFDLFLPDVARVHGVAVTIFLGLVLATLVVAYRRGVLSQVQGVLTVLLALLVAQAAVGYTQYFTGVPPLLVGFHIAGATAVWAATISFLLALHGPDPAVPARGATTPAGILIGT
jgi:heme a synthase